MPSMVVSLMFSGSRWFPPSLLCRLAIFCLVVPLISCLSLVATVCSVWLNNGLSLDQKFWFKPLKLWRFSPRGFTRIHEYMNTRIHEFFLKSCSSRLLFREHCPDNRFFFFNLQICLAKCDSTIVPSELNQIYRSVVTDDSDCFNNLLMN